MASQVSLARCFGLLVLMAAVGGSSACGSEPETESAPDAGPGDGLVLGQQAPFPTREWTVRDPAEMGMDPAILEQAREYAFSEGMNTQSVVVVRGGAIVAEWYADGKGPDSWAASWSMAKSFASALIGIAIDEGLIEGVHVPMKTFFPEWEGSPKGDMTLQSVLWMQSGLDFDEDYGDFSSHVVQLSASSDALSYVLDLDIRHPPDTVWYYSSGDTQLLDGVIQRVTGRSSADYAREKLFEPIGMSPAQWWIDGAGNTFSYCCVDAPTRQFAKFGLLFLREGNWDGEQVISSDWVRESTTQRASQFEGYAYQWWTAESDTSANLPADLYGAHGLDTQRIFVIPSLDLVVAKNTLYEKPPGEAVAPTGWALKFQPRDLLGGYGTKDPRCPAIWENAGLLAPIINSIEGSEKIDFEPTGCGTSDDDPAQCRVEAQRDYEGYCEEMHGCVCDHCAAQFLDCNANPGCQSIIQCAMQEGCRGIGCLQPCQEAIQSAGGTEGVGVTLALDLSECTLACPTQCDS